MGYVSESSCGYGPKGAFISKVVSNSCSMSRVCVLLVVMSTRPVSSMLVSFVKKRATSGRSADSVLVYIKDHLSGSMASKGAQFFWIVRRACKSAGYPHRLSTRSQSCPSIIACLIVLISANDTQRLCSASSLSVSFGSPPCLLYTSDAADEEDSVDLGGRRI